ncbi:hypothetical protein S83_054661, partial [Arachis hypogaea]
RGISEKFSVALWIGDLNDFITPSKAYIVSLKGLKANANKPDSEILVGRNKQIFHDCLCDICGDSYAGEIKKSSDCVCFSPVKGLPCNSFRHFFPSDDVLD